MKKIFGRLSTVNNEVALCVLVTCLAISPDSSAQTCRRLPPDAVSWWPGNGDANDIVAANDGMLQNGAQFAPGTVSQAFSFDGIDDFVQVPDDPSLNPGSNDFTVDFWMNTTSSGVPRAVLNKRPICTHSSFWDIRMTGDGHLFVELDQDAAAANHNSFRSTIAVNDGNWHHVALVRQGTTATLHIDGQVRGSGTTTGITNINNTADLLCGEDPCVGVDVTEIYFGFLDEIQIFRRALSPCEVRSLFLADSAGACKGDSDSDGIVDYEDNCPAVPNAAQDNADSDQAGDACDCDSADPGVLTAPAEMGGLHVGIGDDVGKLAWCTAKYDHGSSTIYDVARGLAHELPVGSGASESCLNSGVMNPETTDLTVPEVGTSYWYLVRGRNSCGVGTYGFTSAGAERITGVCP